MFGKFQNRTYAVGGCVRDKFLGHIPKDYDYVIEATEEEFVQAFPNAPKVGKNFPVFLLHGNEVALTRTEVSTGLGYNDFEISKIGVSIREDLLRRDFTINSMATCVKDSTLLDPFGGQEDLRNKIIRATTPKSFIEDPLRIIRAVRFAVRYDFEIEIETKNLIRSNASTINNLPKERIVAELQKFYVERLSFKKVFELFSSLGILEHLFPELQRLTLVPAGPDQHHSSKTAFEHTMEATERAQFTNNASFAALIAVLFHDIGKGTTPPEELPHHYRHEERSYEITTEIMRNHRFDRYTSEFTPFAALMHMKPHNLVHMSPRKMVRFIKAVPHRYLNDFLAVIESDHPLSGHQRFLYNLLLEVKSMKVDPARIKASKNPSDEVHQQMVSYLKHLLRIREFK